MKPRDRAQKELDKINKVCYYKHVPMWEIYEICKRNGLMMVQEDGQPWSGFLCGHEGRANIDLLYENRACKFWLVVNWYRMEESGNFEVVVYLS